MILGWLIAYSAFGASDPLVTTLENAIDAYPTALKLSDAPSTWHVRYHLLLLEQQDVWASFGGILRETHDPLNALGIEWRVGSPTFDNSGFGGWENGFGTSALPDQLTSRALELAVWRLSDRSYKEAVEHYSRKKAQFLPSEDFPGDYLPGKGEQQELPIPPSIHTDLVRVATEVSGALTSLSTPLDVGSVFIGQENGVHWIVDTEGARIRRPMEETTIRAMLSIRSTEGHVLTDHQLWTVRSPDDLPSIEQMIIDTEDQANELILAAQAPAWEEEYVGPVLFVDSAARDLFRYLLVPQLEGTPTEIPFETWLGDLGEARNAVRLNRRVLPDGWTVVDDPQDDPNHPSFMKFDAEGSKAQRVVAVKGGIVRDLLMSRVPRADQTKPNGHARGGFGERPRGRATQLSIQAPKALSETKLLLKAFKAAAAYHHDYVIMVARLQEPAILSTAAETWWEEDKGLPPPVAIYRLYRDGRVELYQGASFSSVHRWLLRDILASGEMSEGSYLAAASGSASGLGPTEGLPTKISAPAVLIGELELIPSSPTSPTDQILPFPGPTANR